MVVIDLHHLPRRGSGHVFRDPLWRHMGVISIPNDVAASRTMAPLGTASSVFTEFESNGWPATGLACLVGLNGPIAYLSGADSSVHLSEELKNASWVLPRSMVATQISNYITSFIVVGTVFSCPCLLCTRR